MSPQRLLAPIAATTVLVVVLLAGWRLRAQSLPPHPVPAAVPQIIPPAPSPPGNSPPMVPAVPAAPQMATPVPGPNDATRYLLWLETTERERDTLRRRISTELPQAPFSTALHDAVDRTAQVAIRTRPAPPPDFAACDSHYTAALDQDHPAALTLLEGLAHPAPIAMREAVNAGPAVQDNLNIADRELITACQNRRWVPTFHIRDTPLISAIAAVPSR